MTRMQDHLLSPVSAWIEALDRQLVRAKHVLLHGNTSDLALYSGLSGHPINGSQCMTCDVALHQYLVDAGFGLVLHFNIADGLQLVEPSMSEPFKQAYAAATDTAPAQSLDHLLKVGGDAAGALDTIRQLLRQTRHATAVVLHFADKLVSDGGHPHPEELPLLVRLRQAMEGAAYATANAALRNSLIIVASRLTEIPAWVYVDNPRIELVQVSRPTARERRELIGTRLGDFYWPTQVNGDAASVNPDQRTELARELADRTDGLTLFDLSLLPRVSHAEQIPLSDGLSLVRAVRYGKKEDPWSEVGLHRLESAAQLLGSRVMGQDAAIRHVASTLHLAHEGLDAESPRARGGPPKGVFFFVGPTGVGKTELAKEPCKINSAV